MSPSKKPASDLRQKLRRTKIVATLGPATDNPQVLERLLTAGADVVRLNYSHQTHAEHQQRAELLRTDINRYGAIVRTAGLPKQ